VGTAATTRKGIGNLPLELTSFVDREEQLTEAKRQLATSRLLTLIGMGGVGKTRLAVRVAHDVRPEFDDGAWLVRLDLLEDPAMLAQAVAGTLGLREQSALPALDLLAEYLTERRLLLLLDNCEHLLDACAALAVRLLESSLDLQILATSREPLGIQGEVVVSVPPLSVPDGDARLQGEVARFDAVTLFTERAMAVVPEFRLGEDNRAAVAEICQRLDGLPLAIELAAARLRTLPADEIARRLSDRYQLLSSRMRGIALRHQTLWASLEWSYDLCSAEERWLWARLSVFRGGFELDAAEVVCAGDDVPAEAILDLVAALVDKSIVLKEREGPFLRYRLLGMVRDFGWAKLREEGETEALRREHRDWYDRLLHDAYLDWIGPRQVMWLDRMEHDLPNIRSAVDFCLSAPGETDAGLRMTAALAMCYGFVRGRFGEIRHMLEELLQRDPGDSPSRPIALYAAGLLRMFQGEFAAASDLIEQIRAIAIERGDASAEELASRGTGELAWWTGDYRRAKAAFELSVPVLRQKGDVYALVVVLVGLAQSVAAEDEPRASALHQEILAITEPRGELQIRSYALYVLGLAAWRDGDSPRALGLVTQALVLNRELDEAWGAAGPLDTLAWVVESLNEHRRAATLLGAAQALADSLGAPSASPPYLDADRKACERQARSALGEQAFELAFEDGLGMTLDDAVAYALKESAETSPPAAAPADPRLWLPAEPTAIGSLPPSLVGESRGGGTVSVLIVDRHRVVADGIQVLLDQHDDLQVVGIATNAGDALKLASETNPSVIVADYQLPDMTGAALAARLRQEQPAIHVLLLSSVVSSVLLQEAVRAGARGFLLKTQPAEQLVDAVRRAAAGEMLIPAGRLADFLAGSDKDAQLFDLLTGREREVLRQLAAGLDNRQIAKRMEIGYVTVRSHLRNLSSKLDAHSKVEILARAAELGLIAR
jgi:non-specific serine/threonine protein kinase